MKMSKNLKRKIALLVVVVAASLVAMGFMLNGLQDNMSMASFRAEMEQEAEQLVTLLAEADDETAQNKQTFDDIYRSKADSVAFMAHNIPGFELTDAKMDEMQQLLEVDNVMVVKKDGTVVAKAEDTKADFASSRFNYLRECLSTGEPSRAVEIELPEQDWLMRYYAAQIDADTMVVVEQNPAELRELIAETGSTESVLRNISIGTNGYVFALSAQDYIIEYHPNEELVGVDAIDAGIDVTQLEDGLTEWMTLDGESIYARVSLIDDTYYLCAIPAADMAGARNVTVGVVLFAFLVVMATVALYGIFIMREDERDGDIAEEYVPLGAKLRYNKVIGKKAIVLSLVGIIAVLGVSFYMQTLFALSAQSVTNNDRAASIAETIERTNARAEELTAQYNERYLSKAHVAAYILDRAPEVNTKAKMQELADALQIKNVYLFNGNGEMVISNAPYGSFTLSEDPKDQSYEFRALIQGVDELVQEPMKDDMTGELRQYVGVATHDEQGYVDGFVQLGIRSSRLETLLASVQIDHVLDGVKAGADGFAFAIDKTDGTFAYFPDASVQGKAAVDMGMLENQIKGGYDDYITVNGTTYYASSVEAGDYILYVAGPEGALMAERGPLTAVTGGMALLCIAVLFVLVTISPAAGSGAVAEAADEDERIIDITTPSGRRTTTESAVSRWLNTSLSWDEKTPEQKLGTVLRWFAGLGVVVVFVAVLFQEQIFGSGSIFSYILGGGWERGMNIFAITAALMTACVIFTVSGLIQKVLQLLSGVLSARGETVCRLLMSLVKYGAILGTLYWSLATIGIDTATLLASAGLLSLAISFGAKDLVTDLLCGLFIIFEGEFRVGDSISVGANTGTVMEIGIRTTKINDGSGNVIVLRNSAISNVTNRTKLDSYASIDVIVPVGEDLTYVESVLKTGLPIIAERQPSILDGPFYKGVVALDAANMTLRITARCAEGDRGALERTLKREMRLLFTRFNVAPYQQVHTHEEAAVEVAEKVDKAAEREQKEADEFLEEQIESAKNLGNEDAK